MKGLVLTGSKGKGGQWSLTFIAKYRYDVTRYLNEFTLKDNTPNHALNEK